MRLYFQSTNTTAKGQMCGEGGRCTWDLYWHSYIFYYPPGSTKPIRPKEGSDPFKEFHTSRNEPTTTIHVDPPSGHGGTVPQTPGSSEGGVPEDDPAKVSAACPVSGLTNCTTYTVTTAGGTQSVSASLKFCCYCSAHVGALQQIVD